MTLSQVCDLLGVSARKVQYLRENNIVIPHTQKNGRGRACLYSEDDAVWLWVALVELDGVVYEKRREIITSLRQDQEASLGEFSEIRVCIEDVQKRIQSLIH
jgi:DNA-binding transcriptional MerR regulator